MINCFDFFSAEVVKRPVKHHINLVLPKCHSVHFKLNLASNGFTTKTNWLSWLPKLQSRCGYESALETNWIRQPESKCPNV